LKGKCVLKEKRVLKGKQCVLKEKQCILKEKQGVLKGRGAIRSCEK
jgi:hypothetical protein